MLGIEESMNKNEVRGFVIKKRNMLDENILNANADKIFSNFLSDDRISNLIQNIKYVFLYANYNNEASTKDFFSYFHSNNVVVGYPKITDNANRKMSFYKVDSLKELKKGYMGILEPVNSQCLDEFANEALMLVPIVAFDENCNRLGYGGGFYDRYMSSLKSTLKIGIAHEIQRVDDLPIEELDLKLDFIVTDKKVYGGQYEWN